jgi:hypothetical protein
MVSAGPRQFQDCFSPDFDKTGCPITTRSQNGNPATSTGP